MTDETLIEITDLADVRAGDTVTMSYEGHEFTGVAWWWAQGEEPNALMIGPHAVRWMDGTSSSSFGFVRATRPKLDLPTEAGTIIAVTLVNGDKVVCVLNYTGEWRILTPRRLFWRLVDKRLILDWRFAPICVEDPNGELVDWGDL